MIISSGRRQEVDQAPAGGAPVYDDVVIAAVDQGGGARAMTNASQRLVAVAVDDAGG
jgi:hypothetical protein